jgi:hypothetical protein
MSAMRASAPLTEAWRTIAPAAATILARTGDAVVLCPTYGTARGSTA